MTDPALLEVIECCQRLERLAARFYSRQAAGAVEDGARRFWREVAADEGQHLRHWEALLATARDSTLPAVLDDAPATAAALRELEAEAERLTVAADDTPPAGAGEAALRLELAMLHPAFALLLHFAESDSAETAAATAYERHLRRFAGPDFPGGGAALRLVQAAVLDLWARNRELARQAREIRALRRCIPACAACHKVRGADGVWQTLGAYVEANAGVAFSHGLCPSCAAAALRDFEAGRRQGQPPPG